METTSTLAGLKRSASDEEAERAAKRAKPTHRVIKHHAPAGKQPGVDLLQLGSLDAGLAEDSLRRAICVALYAAGFTSAQPDALESLLAATEEYMTTFARRVAHSMQLCRRSQPLPQDFAQALAQSQLRSSTLELDLKTPIPAEVTQLPIMPVVAPRVPAEYKRANAFDRQESKMSTDKTSRRYVPAHFPTFPSEHTFRSTAIFTMRETDARKVREQATHEGMEAEKALRKLMAASKATKGSRRRLGGIDDERRQERENIWRETLEAVSAEDEKMNMGIRQDSMMFGVDGAAEEIDELDRGVEVNYDKMFWRRGNGVGA